MSDDSSDAPIVNGEATGGSSVFMAPQVLDPSSAIALEQGVEDAKARGWLKEDLNRFFKRKGITAALYRGALRGEPLETSDQRSFLVGLSITGLPDAPSAPNVEDIRAHVEWLIAPARGDYDDALIEIAFDRPSEGPKSARLFGLDEIDEAVAFAAEQNAKRSNVYIGAALRLPDADRNHRCSSADFYVATAVPIDIDRDYDATRAKMATICQDGLVVATGLTPERRSQHWVRLIEPCDSDIEFGLAFAGLVYFTGADMAVKDSARIMRLGGTVSYPNERKISLGYCTELTSVMVNPNAASIALEPLKEHAGDAPTRSDRPHVERSQGATNGIQRGGKFGTKVVNGREEFWRNVVLRHLAVFQEQNGCDPTSDEIWETAFPEFEREADNEDGRWTSPSGQKELRYRIDNTIRRLRAGRLAKVGLYSVETEMGREQAEQVNAPAPQEPKREIAFDPWERYPVPKFPLHTLPPKLAEFVQMTAKSVGGDVNAVAMAALTVCSAAVDQEFRLVMKRTGGWRVPPRLWTVLVGDPSSKKTPIITACASPLRRAEKVNVDLWKSAFSRWSGDKKNKAEDLGDEPSKPIRYIFNSITIEKLGEILSRQNRGALVEQDELAGWIGAMDKYGGGKGAAADRAFWLQAYNAVFYTVDRVGRGEIFIDNLCVSFLAGVQPSRIAELGNLTSDGLLQRFLPVMMTGSEFPQEVENDFAQAGYDNLCMRLMALKPINMKASDGALEVFHKFQIYIHELEKMQAMGEHFCAFVGKLTGIQGSLSLLLHLMDDDAVYEPVSRSAAERATEILNDFVIPHGLEFYSSTLDKGDWTALRALASFVLTSSKERFTAADFTAGVTAMRGLGVWDLCQKVSPLIAGGWLEEDGKTVPAKAWNVAVGLRDLLKERRENELTRKAEIIVALKEIRSKSTRKSGEIG